MGMDREELLAGWPRLDGFVHHFQKYVPMRLDVRYLDGRKREHSDGLFYALVWPAEGVGWRVRFSKVYLNDMPKGVDLPMFLDMPSGEGFFMREDAMVYVVDLAQLYAREIMRVNALSNPCRVELVLLKDNG